MKTLEDLGYKRKRGYGGWIDYRDEYDHTIAYHPENKVVFKSNGYDSEMLTFDEIIALANMLKGD